MLSITFVLILLLKPDLSQQTGCNDSLEYASDCPIWATHDECTKSPGFMELYCKKSCNRCPAQSSHLEPLVNFARSAPEMGDESGCQCSSISVTLTNGARQAQSSREGTYKRSVLVNGKPSWTTNFQAIWFVPESKFWCIGALSGIGTDVCGVSSMIGINDHFSNCAYGVPKNSWEFHASLSGWTIAGANDVNVNCLDQQGCQTVSGPDAHKSCKFPFVYQGQVFFTCTTMDNDHQPWCATEVNDKNHLIIGKWGSCSNACPPSVQSTGKGTDRDPTQLVATIETIANSTDRDDLQSDDCNNESAKQKIRQINQLRGWRNIVTCSQNLVYIAYLHTMDQIAWTERGGTFPTHCNMHSWHDDQPCCYPSDHSNAPCMWKAFENRLGWSIGNIYEVSAMNTKSGYSFDDAIAQWRSSGGHNVVISGTNGWDRNTKKGGCYQHGSFANCFFSA